MTAFDQLRAPQRLADPDRTFVDRLRADLVAALRASALPTVELADRDPVPAGTDDAGDAATVHGAATGRIVPYLAVRGAVDAIDWYRSVFGAVELVRYTADDGTIGHAELSVGGATFYLSDEYVEYGAVSPARLGGTPVALNMLVADVDTVFATAIGAGATAQREPADQPYGERSCAFVDPWGHRWLVQTTIATPTVAEIDAAMDGFTVSSRDDTADDPADGTAR